MKQASVLWIGPLVSPDPHVAVTSDTILYLCKKQLFIHVISCVKMPCVWATNWNEFFFMWKTGYGPHPAS